MEQDLALTTSERLEAVLGRILPVPTISGCRPAGRTRQTFLCGRGSPLREAYSEPANVGWQLGLVNRQSQLGELLFVFSPNEFDPSSDQLIGIEQIRNICLGPADACIGEKLYFESPSYALNVTIGDFSLVLDYEITKGRLTLGSILVSSGGHPIGRYDHDVAESRLVWHRLGFDLIDLPAELHASGDGRYHLAMDAGDKVIRYDIHPRPETLDAAVNRMLAGFLS